MKNKIEKELANLPDKKESVYPFLVSIYLLLKLNDAPVTFNEVSAMSGYPVRFFYKFGEKRIYDCSKEFILKNLFALSGIRIEKTGISKLKAEDLPFVSAQGDLLFAKSEEGSVISVSSAGDVENAEIPETGAAYRFASKERITRSDFYSKEKFVFFSRLIQAEFYRESVSVCGTEVFSGRLAFDKLANDLRNPEITFSGSDLLNQFYIQVSLLSSIPVYLLGLHHFIDRKFQDRLSRAIQSFEDAAMYAREYERIVKTEGKVPISDRRRLANSVKKLSSSLRKGLEILSEVEPKV